MRVVGYAVAILGAALLAIYAGYYFVVDFVLGDDVHLIVRLAVSAIVLGGLLVIASLVRERLGDNRGESFRGQMKAPQNVLITTTEGVEGRTIVRTIGLVTGSTIRARHLGRDVVAALRNVVGGEVKEYTKLMAEAREQALERMAQAATVAGANGVVGMRFSTSMVMTGAAEILVYGTAVVIE